MSDDEDDYLSDKFLVGSPSSSSSLTAKPSTYSELRKQAIRASEAKNDAARKKSRREIVEEGLSTSLFEKAREQEEQGRGKNKALGMMMKMGFKPGQPLGRSNSSLAPVETGLNAEPPSGDILSGVGDTANDVADLTVSHDSTSQSLDEIRTDMTHRLEPIKVSLWEGKQGIGVGQKRSAATFANPYSDGAKRARLVSGVDTIAKEKETAEAFRERTRREYEEKRAEARLIAAMRTCTSLDEQKGGLKFNYLWLNPLNPNTCPPELLLAFRMDAAAFDAQHGDEVRKVVDAVGEESGEEGGSDDDLRDTDGWAPGRRRRGGPADATVDRATKLRAQMRKDALLSSEQLEFGDEYSTDSPLAFGPGKRDVLERNLEDITGETETMEFTSQQVTEAREYLGLPAKDRLERVLTYMRERYSYCFWCGTQYEDKEDLESSCPGEDEDSHD